MYDLIVILIPLFPLLAVLANGLNVMLGHRYSHDIAHRIGWGSVLLSFLCAIWVFGQTLGHPEPRTVIAYRWFFGGDLAVNLGFLIDPLTCVMMLVVTGVGFLIHVYSVGYMHGEEGFTRFFAYMNLFMVSMLLLVMGNNYAVLFIGWEGVGLCSYLLIGYYYDRVSAAKAATKAFVVNRIGDAGFLIAIFFVFARFGTLDYTEVFAKVDTLDSTTAFAIAVCLLIGAVGKSAQLPLYTWLPDAMEGPTPVSALIHAATMVTAGVYMVARCHPLFLLAPGSLETVAVVGAATGLFAATIGLAQNDIKRVLAYSTVTQLGYMFMACGGGAFSAGIFHLMTHAFFKALLFLGAGSAIHALSDEQDLRSMGGLARKLPWTHGTMLVATLANAGIPPLAGFFSKDEILSRAFATGHSGVWLVGLVGAALTAFYMFRLYVLAFRGPSRLSHEAEHHLHESPPSMVIPLVMLAVLSAVGGLVGQPMQEGGHLFERWMRPVFEGVGGEAAAPLSPRTEWTLIALSVAAAALGIYGAYRTYLVEPGLAARLRERLRAFHQAVLHKYWIDELYDALVVAPVYHLSQRLWGVWDERV